MSYIERLEITGIRSYNPEKPTQMEFLVPMTLIVGHNGSGKTTLIEALKFICTGDTPSSKAAFVHDLKLAKKSVLRGQVKLLFRDIEGNRMIVSRALETTLKKTAASAKTLDGSLKKIGPNGESTALKVKNLDMEMMRLIGSSKSVINNVIFCHQEDNLWPLSEGSLVKKKFDDIFGQKRNVKLVDDMKKNYKKLKDEYNIAKTALVFLEDNMKKANEIEEEIKISEQKLKLAQDEIKVIEQKIEDANTKYDEHSTTIQNYQQLEKNYSELATKVETLESSKRQVEQQMRNIFQKPIQELEIMLSNFEERYKAERQRQVSLASSLTEAVKSYEEKKEHAHNLMIDLERSKAAREAYKVLVEEYNGSVKDLASEVEINSELLLGNLKERPESIVQVLPWVEDCIDKAKRREGIRASDAEKQQKTLEAHLQKIQKEINQGEGELNSKKDTKKKLKDEMDKLRVEIQQLKQAESKLDDMENQLEGAEKEYADYISTCRLEEISQKIDDKTTKMKEISEKQIKLSGDLEKINLENDTRQKKARTEADMDEKKSEVEKLLSRHQNFIATYLKDKVQKGKYIPAIKSYLAGKSTAVKQQRKTVKVHEAALVSKESEFELTRKHLDNIKNDARKIRDKISQVCTNPANFEEEVSTAEMRYKEAEKSVAGSASFQYLYEKWRDKIQESHTCPMCKTSLDSTRAEVVVKGMNAKIDRAPQTLEDKKKKQLAAEEKFFALKGAVALHKQLEVLEKEKIPKLEGDIVKLTTEIDDEKENVEDANDAIAALVAEELAAKDVESEFYKVDVLQSDIRKLEGNLVQLTKKLGNSPSMSLSEALEAQRKYQETYRSIQSECEKLNNRKRQVESMKQDLQDKCNAMKQQFLDTKLSLQKIKSLEDKRKEKAQEIHQLCQNEKSIEEKVKPLEKELTELESNLKSIRDENVKTQKSVAGLLNNLSNKVNNVRNIKHKVRMSNVHEHNAIDKLQSQIAEEENEIEVLKKQKSDLERDLKKSEEETASREVQRRDIRDSIQIIQLDIDIKRYSTEAKDIKKEMKELNIENVNAVSEDLKAKIDDLTRQKASHEGRNKGFKDQIKKLNNELQSDMFKDAGTKYHNKLIDCVVTEGCVNDLNAYINAFERAIMRFHNEKMRDINEYLRDLWQQVYRGSDIDYVEIRTDEEVEGETVGRRRTCHYRVVKVQNGVHIDMRLHSSAGQRVLASLLIRLALAEAFCDQCGIIALDEPTTNLDRANIEGLAQSLSSFIKHRSSLTTFQLIIITHDEDFVHLLGKNEYTDHFYRVEKEGREGYSVITKNSVITAQPSEDDRLE